MSETTPPKPSAPLPAYSTLCACLASTLDELDVRAPPAPTSEHIVRHLQELYRWNRRINLTGIRDWKEGLRRHAVEALEGWPWIEGLVGDADTLLVDLGSGNGYPALPLLFAQPRLRGLLVESSGRKCDFLNAVIRRNGVGERVSCLHQRIASPADIPSKASIITMRAFPNPGEWIPRLLEEVKPDMLLAWLSRADGENLKEQLLTKHVDIKVCALRAHATGVLLVTKRSRSR